MRHSGLPPCRPELFSLVAQQLGQVCVARPLLYELEAEIDIDNAEALGLTIVDVAEEDVVAVVNRPKNTPNDIWGPLSDYDTLCLLTAQRYGHICVTNDRNLRKACEHRGVSLKWGLQIVLELLEAGAIDCERAQTIGKRVFETNRWLGQSVLARFLKKTEEFRR